jgi:hypothetical protein
MSLPYDSDTGYFHLEALEGCQTQIKAEQKLLSLQPRTTHRKIGDWEARRGWKCSAFLSVSDCIQPPQAAIFRQAGR